MCSLIFTPFLADDNKNNQFLQSDGTSQKVSRDEIMNLKAQGVSGKVKPGLTFIASLTLTKTEGGILPISILNLNINLF